MLRKVEKKTYVIFSPLEGVLMDGGQPLPNASLTRRLRWNGNDEGLVQSFTSDDQGRFSLPVHEEALTLGKLTQFVAKADISVEFEGVYQDVWYSTKFEPEIFAETGAQLRELVCDLEKAEVTVRPGVSKVSTICRWANMPESGF